jgi:predicted transcriptional regulator
VATDGGDGGVPAADLGAAVAVGAALAAGGAVIALSRTDVGRMVAAAATLPLYTRLAKQDVLQHEVRSGIHVHVSRHPGIRFEDLRRALGLANGVLVFHLRVLERNGFVTAHKEWTRRRFYATGAVPTVPTQGVAATMAQLLRDAPGIPPAEIARRLGISRQLARYHLRRLETEGVLVAQGEGNAVAYRVRQGP